MSMYIFFFWQLLYARMNKNSVRPARQKAQPDCGLQSENETESVPESQSESQSKFQCEVEVEVA